MAGAGVLAGWPVRLAPAADLVCVAGAGAGASPFRGWAARLPGFAAVAALRLPGRESRIDEPFAANLAAAADEAADALLARPPRPLVLFGHSMGGAIAFETARRLADAGRPPAALVLAASAPPAGTGAAPDDEDLAALLAAYDPGVGGIAAEPELLAALRPVLAADIAMLRRHRVVGPPLGAATALHLAAGEADAMVPPAATARWQAHSAAPAALHGLPGGHFFPFREAEPAVLALLGRLLREAARGG